MSTVVPRQGICPRYLCEDHYNTAVVIYGLPFQDFSVAEFQDFCRPETVRSGSQERVVVIRQVW